MIGLNPTAFIQSINYCLMNLNPAPNVKRFIQTSHKAVLKLAPDQDTFFFFFNKNTNCKNIRSYLLPQYYVSSLVAGKNTYKPFFFMVVSWNMSHVHKGPNRKTKNILKVHIFVLCELLTELWHVCWMFDHWLVQIRQRKSTQKICRQKTKV